VDVVVEVVAEVLEVNIFIFINVIISHFDIFSVLGGYVFLAFFSRNNRISCETPDCRLENALLGAGIVVAGFILCVPICACIACWHLCCGKTQLQQKNIISANSGYEKSHRQGANYVYPFQSGIWSSRYFQYKKWHGPHQFPLSFDPQSMKVTGSGSDDVGVFTIDGIYSTESNRIDLTKTYQLDNRSENLGNQVTIQLIWNCSDHQFKGKLSAQTSRYDDDTEFELEFCGVFIKSKLLLILLECLSIIFNCCSPM
jgi:hypothetical protein